MEVHPHVAVEPKLVNYSDSDDARVGGCLNAGKKSEQHAESSRRHGQPIRRPCVGLGWAGDTQSGHSALSVPGAQLERPDVHK